MKTLRIILLFSFIFIPGMISMSFSQEWQWAHNFGSINSDAGSPDCIDSSGNIYMSGNFFFPQGIFGTDTIPTNGINDIFIVKINNNGNFIWVKRAGGYNPSSSENGGTIIYEESSNSLLIAGRMDGSNEIIDSCVLGGGQKIFLTKMDLNGNCIWTITQGFNGLSVEFYLSSDNNGNIYLYGKNLYSSYFKGSYLPAGGFLSKFNSLNGTCLWVKNIFNTNNTADGMQYFNNSIYLSGTCLKDTLHIDSINIKGHYYDAFISKFDTSGHIRWVTMIGGRNQDNGGPISVDQNENIYITGTFKDTAYFNNIMLTNGNHRDWYLAKYNSDGNISWVQQAHADSVMGYTSNLIDKSGNIYVAGIFSGSATLGNSSIIASSPNDLFVARYDESGSCFGVNQVGNILYGSVLSDANDAYYVGGGFNGSVNFGNNTITSYGLEDVYISKHDAITGENEPGNVGGKTLIIYANPTAGTCNITVPDEFLHEKQLTLRIYDSMGKLIQQKQLEMNGGKIKLSLDREAKGIYNAILSNGKKNYTGKIVFN